MKNCEIKKQSEEERQAVLARVKATMAEKAALAKEKRTREEMKVAARPLVHRLNLHSFSAKPE